MSVTWSLEQYAHNARLLFPAPVLKRSEWLGVYNRREVFVYAPEDGKCGRLVWMQSTSNPQAAQHVDLSHDSSISCRKNGRGAELHVASSGRNLHFRSDDFRVVQELAAALEAAARPSRLTTDLLNAIEDAETSPRPLEGEDAISSGSRPLFVSWASQDAPAAHEAPFVSWADPSWARAAQ